MRVWIAAACLFFISGGAANCLPSLEVAEMVESVHDNPCYGYPDCMHSQIEEIERMLSSQPDDLLLHRLHQDRSLEAARFTETEAKTEAALLARYQAESALSPQARAYLTARVERDADQLREAAEWFPWARLDLMRHPLQAGQQAMVEPEEAEGLLDSFFAECPDAASLLVLEIRWLVHSLRWPVWGEIRRQLLSMDPPAWHRVDDSLIRAGLFHDDGGDPAERQLAELDELAGSHETETDYWSYRARIHLLARQPDRALQANARIRSIDPCEQISPGYRQPTGDSTTPDRSFFDEIGQEILDCPPDYDTYQSWFILAGQTDGSIPEAVVDRIRRAVSAESFGVRTPTLERHLAITDIVMGQRVHAAWDTLDRFFTEANDYMNENVPERSRANYAASLVIYAYDHARLGMVQGHLDQGTQWRARGDRLFDPFRSTLTADPGYAELLKHVNASRSELDWLQARAEQRHADAVVHALTARSSRHPWIDMDEVLQSWTAAGGSQDGFEQLLKIWDLDLPAKWRGWRKLDETMPEFELDDMDGATWTTVSLDGKRTLVNLWATWCGPCMQELPKVQEIHEYYRDNPEIQVLTINLDADNAVARQLVAREGWDFPVLVSGHQSPAFGELAIPRNWLVDGDGIRQWEQTGFNLEIAEHWVEDISSLLEMLD